MKYLIVFLLFFSASCSRKIAAADNRSNCGPACSDSGLLASTKIDQEIKMHGAKQEVNRLSTNPTLWKLLIDSVEHGQKEWVSVAEVLLRGADAGSSEALEAALGVTLLVNPKQILMRIGLIHSACQGPDVDDPRFNSYEKAFKSTQMRIEKVSTVNDSNLVAARNQCLDLLKASLQGTNDFFRKK